MPGSRRPPGERSWPTFGLAGVAAWGLVNERAITLVALGALLLAGVLVINLPALGAWWYARRFGLSAAALPAAQRLVAGDRVLVVAPHPDDEVLCCAGMVLQAHEAGAQVWIVYVTAGDAFELDAILLERKVWTSGEPMLELGRRRLDEARSAAAMLGVAHDHVVVLGFPDRGLRALVDGDPKKLFRSRFTLRSSVPYEAAQSPGLAYTGENLRAELRKVLAAVNPTVVLAPIPRDAHPDHRAVGELMIELLGERRQLDIGRWWIVHGDREWPLPKGVHLRQPLFPPLRARNVAWERFDLEPQWVATKLRAIYAYRSQVDLMRRFLEAFARRNELVSRSPAENQYRAP